MADYQYKINGVALNDYFHVLQDTLFRPNHDLVRNVIEINGRHGSINPHQLPVYKEAILSFTLAAFEHDYLKPSLGAHTIHELDDLLNALFGSGDLLISRTVDGDETVAHADLAIPPTLSGDYGVDGGKWVVGVTLTHPFFEDPSASDTAATSPDATIAELADSTAPIQHNTVIRVDGVGPAAITVSDQLSGTGFIWSGGAASHIYVDLTEFTAWTSSAADDWDEEGSSEKLSYPANGVLQLYPTVDSTNPFKRVYRLHSSQSGVRFVVHTAGAYL